MWYRKGKITVATSNVIQGIETDWLSVYPSIKASQPILVNGGVYEILAVVSDTELYTTEVIKEEDYVTESDYAILTFQPDIQGMSLDFANTVQKWNNNLKDYNALLTSNEDEIVVKDLGLKEYKLPTWKYVVANSGLPFGDNQDNKLLQYENGAWVCKSLNELQLYTKAEVDNLLNTSNANLQSQITTLQEIVETQRLTIESMEQRLQGLENE